MSRDLTSALGALLSDGRLRDEFRRDPAACAAHLGLDPAEHGAFLALDPAELEVQGEGLLDKRLAEVARLTPETFALLGAAAGPLFAEYAATRWPEGHRRHVDDALAFLRFLRSRRERRVSGREQNRLGFVLARRRLAVHVVALRLGGRSRPALQLLTSSRGEPRERLYSFVWP